MVDLNIDLPKGFLEEEIRWDYTVTKQMKEIWAIQLDLLNELLKVCNKHDIKIFASGGTMLGTVRHKGFIPWDDDIDMMMFRADYEKLCSIAKNEFEAPYFFQTEYTDPGSLRGHAQLRNSNTTAILKGECDLETNRPLYRFNQGIFIDIFPLDEVADDDKLIIRQQKKVQRMRRRMFKVANISNRYVNRKKSGVKGLIKKVLHYIVQKGEVAANVEQKIYAAFEKECQRYNDRTRKEISSLSLDVMNKQFYKDREDYQEIIMMPFEFMEIPVGKNYDHALRKRYGNYMEIVKAGSLHGGVIFDTDKSYIEYL
ncbi:MAG: LicD family protein [Lachnospiraceae bacterium]|nr:LicD family protein [Lachnospiraceae bacterium]